MSVHRAEGGNRGVGWGCRSRTGMREHPPGTSAQPQHAAPAVPVAPAAPARVLLAGQLPVEAGEGDGEGLHGTERVVVVHGESVVCHAPELHHDVVGCRREGERLGCHPRTLPTLFPGDACSSVPKKPPPPSTELSPRLVCRWHRTAARVTENHHFPIARSSAEPRHPSDPPAPLPREPQPPEGQGLHSPPRGTSATGGRVTGNL